MKIIVKKEFDGKHFVGSCENIPNCYAQSIKQEDLLNNLRRAIDLYRKSYENKNQELPDRPDGPVIDRKIRFNKISTNQLSKLLTKFRYRAEYNDNHSVIFVNSSFPFNRILLPETEDLSPLIIAKIFGIENIIYVNKSDLSMHSSA